MPPSAAVISPQARQGLTNLGPGLFRPAPLLVSYRDLSGPFRALRREDPQGDGPERSRSPELLPVQTLRPGRALLRRPGKRAGKWLSPLLVEVVRVMTPAREEGSQGYQALVEPLVSRPLPTPLVLGTGHQPNGENSRRPPAQNFGRRSF